MTISGKDHPRVAITYHYSLSFGGSERVLEVFAGMYPRADFFSLMIEPAFVPEKLRGRKITTSFLDRIPGGKRIYRHLLPLYPIAVECLDLSGYDLVISADGAATKGVLTDQGALHLCYCHSPPRSYWDQYAVNRREMPWLVRSAFAPVSQYLRQWDFASAQRIDGFIANSCYVADRIEKYYRRQSTVIYPPVDMQGIYIAAKAEDYYLSVGRLVAAKRVDLAIQACNRLGRKLRIIGSGPEEPALRAMAGPGIEFLGRTTDVDLKRNYASCRALLFAADEDFGLVSVEVQSYGRPVIAYGRGGSLETVRGMCVDHIRGRRLPREDFSSISGLFFLEQTATSLAEAMVAFEEIESCLDPVAIQQHALRFGTPVFVEKMQQYVLEQFDLRAQSYCRRLPTKLDPPGASTSLAAS